MKSLQRLKLTQLSKAELDRREQNSIFGGTHYDYQCCCGCTEGETKPVMDENGAANMEHNYTKTAGWGVGYDKCACACETDGQHCDMEALEHVAAFMGEPL